VGVAFIFTKSAPDSDDGAAVFEGVIQTLGTYDAPGAEALGGLLIERITVKDLWVGSAAATP